MEDFKWTTFLIAWILALSRTTKKKKKIVDTGPNDLMPDRQIFVLVNVH